MGQFLVRHPRDTTNRVVGPGGMVARGKPANVVPDSMFEHEGTFWIPGAPTWSVLPGFANCTGEAIANLNINVAVDLGATYTLQFEASEDGKLNLGLAGVNGDTMARTFTRGVVRQDLVAIGTSTLLRLRNNSIASYVGEIRNVMLWRVQL